MSSVMPSDDALVPGLVRPHNYRCSILALPSPFVRLERLLRLLDPDPHPIPLQYRGNIREPCLLRRLGERLDLADPFIACAPSSSSLHCGAPLLLPLPQALAKTAAAKDRLIQIHPTSLILFQNGTVARHIIIADHPPACREIAAVMTSRRN